MTRINETMATSTHRPRHQRRQVLLALVVFICGILIGIGLTSRYLWSHYAERQPSFPGLSSRITNHMIEELELDETQAQEIRAIMKRWEGEIQQIHHDTHDRFETIFAQIHTEFAEVLSEEQMARWDRRIEMMKERWSKRGGSGGRPDRNRGDDSPRGKRPHGNSSSREDTPPPSDG